MPSQVDDQDLAILRYVSGDRSPNPELIARYRTAMLARGPARRRVLPALFVSHPWLIALIEPIERPRNAQQRDIEISLRIATSMFEASIDGARALTEAGGKLAFVRLALIALIEGACLPLRFLANRLGAPWTPT